MKPDETALIEELLKQRAQAAATGAATGGPLCGDPELLAAYAENFLDEEERASFQIHLASCTACREALAALVRMAPREILAEAPAHAVSWWKQWIWVPALAGLLVAGSVLLMNRYRAQEEPRRVAQLDSRVEPAKKAPPATESFATAPSALTETSRKGVVKRDAPTTKPADTLENAGGGGSLPAAPRQDKLVADAPVLRKQEVLQIAPAASLGGQNQSQNLTNQGQNAARPGPFVSNMQNGNANTVVATAQNGADQSNNSQSARMLRMAPQVAKTPPPTPSASAAGALSASPLFKANGALTVAKGRVEKGKLQLSTDGGATWQAIATPEPVVSFQITDALNFEIHTQSLSVFRTKDGGKTWQQEKAPQP